jgi:hypothetical protein
VGEKLLMAAVPKYTGTPNQQAPAIIRSVEEGMLKK